MTGHWPWKLSANCTRPQHKRNDGLPGAIEAALATAPETSPHLA